MNIEVLRAGVEQRLQELVVGLSFTQDVAIQAASYSLLGGGKRIRALLVQAVARDLGGEHSSSIAAACSIEMLHAASLIHDDLPALDNDDERRGRPSCHRKFSEGIAVLAGDLLIGAALASLHTAGLDLMLVSKLSALLSNTWIRLCVGQSMDVSERSLSVTADVQETMKRLKTGALFGASAAAGAMTAGLSEVQVAQWQRWGEDVGLLFQKIDDVLDGEQGAVSGEILRHELVALMGQGRALSGIGEKDSWTASIVRSILPEIL
jgi:geranylgeranyl diphosphate synthase type II